MAQLVPLAVLVAVVVHDVVVHRRLFAVTVASAVLLVVLPLLFARLAVWPPVLEWFAGPLHAG